MNILNDAIRNNDLALVENLLSKESNEDLNLLLISLLEKEILKSGSIEIIKLLLKYGADTGVINEKGNSSLSNAIFVNRPDIVSLLLNYGAISTINNLHPFTLFSVLDQAIIHSGLDMIKLLLDSGADCSTHSDVKTILEESIDFAEYIWGDVQNYSQRNYEENISTTINKLLDQNNYPYLNLGKDLKNKYIIYENRTIDKEVVPYILSDFKEQKDKKYLYSSCEISLLVYWAFKNDLLHFNFSKVIKKFQIEEEKLSFDILSSILTNTIINQFTIDIFNKKGKIFISDYFIITHWHYNYFHDLKKLYPSNEILINLPDNKETFKKVFKLLDTRLAQYESKKHHNPNQN